MAVDEAYTPTRLQADGLITSFAADFPVIETSHLVVQVLLRADDSVVKVAVEGVDYTVVIDQSTRKPTVTFVPASVPLATQDVFLTRAVPLTQESDIPTNNLFREPVVEDAIDKLTMISQQNDEAIGRAILLPQTWIGGQISVPLPEAGKALKWNATEDGLENSTVDIEDIDSAVAATVAAQVAAEAAQAAAEAAQAAAEHAQGDAETAQAAAEAAANGINRVVILKPVLEDESLTTGDGKMYFVIPAALNGMNLIAAAAHVYTASSGAAPTIQIYNATKAQDMLSTRITIDANEKDSKDAATPAVIDTAKDDVATGDELRIDVDVAGTGTKGLEVRLTFH